MVEGTGRTVTALDLARHAVDTGVTHLRQAEAVLARVRRAVAARPRLTRFDGGRPGEGVGPAARRSQTPFGCAATY